MRAGRAAPSMSSTPRTTSGCMPCASNRGLAPSPSAPGPSPGRPSPPTPTTVTVPAFSPRPAFRRHVEQGPGAGLVPARGGVDEDGGVVAAGEVVGEVHAADPVVGHPDPAGQADRGEPLGDLGAEPVVTEEDVADTSDQHP